MNRLQHSARRCSSVEMGFRARHGALLSYTLYDRRLVPFTTPRSATSTISKRTLRNCETAKACRTSDQRPTGRVVALPWAMAPKRSYIESIRSMTVKSDSPFQVGKENPCWPPVKKEAGEPMIMRQKRSVGCHDYMLDM